MFQNLNPIFDLQRYGFVHEKPFLPGERYSISREMERNVKGYKVILMIMIIMVMIMIRGMMVIILLFVIITKGSSRLMMIKMMIFI